MKTTILGIEVGYNAVIKMKSYLKESRKDKKENTNYSGWSCGYTMAKAESELDMLEEKGKITTKEHQIIYKFMHHIQFPKITKNQKLYSKGWY